MRYIQLLIIAVLLTACGGAKKKASHQAEGNAVAFKYATQISIGRIRLTSSVNCSVVMFEWYL